MKKLFSSKALAWAGKGFWAVTDQALFAGSNFLVSVLLARWLEPAAYGAFSVAYSLFLLLGTLHTALWTEPMLVYGSGRFRGSFRAYQGALLRDHWRFGGGVALAFLLLAAVFGALGQKEMALSFLGLSLAAPSVLYLWLVRRGAYVLLEPRLAAAGGALYLALYVGLALLLLKTGLLNEATAFWGMALAALLAAWAIRARVPGEGSEGVDPEEVRRLHWGYGRWALLAGALSWVPMNAFFLVLPGVHGLEVAATLKALLNLVMPILHFNGAIASLFVPVFVSALQKGKLGRAIWVGGVALTLPSLLFWLIGASWGRSLVEWVYGGRYVEVAFVLKALGMLPLFAAWINTWGAVLRSLEKPSLVAFGYAFSALLTVALGVPLVFSMGLQGAVFAMTMAYAALSLILFVFASRLLGTFNEMRAGK